MPVLIARCPDGARTEHRFHERVLIGRGPGCDLILEDPRISTHHAILVFEHGGEAYIRDLGSMNGTRVDGRRGVTHYLEDESEIRLGDTRLFFQLEPDEATMVRIPQSVTTAAFTTENFEIEDPEELEDLGHELLCRYQLAQVLHAVQGPGEVVAALAQQVVWATTALRVAVLITGESGELEPRFCHPRGELPNDGKPLSRSVMQAVMEGREPLLVPMWALGGDPRSNKTDDDERLALCAPICSDDRHHGVIITSHLDPRTRFDARQVRIVSDIGLQGGLALDNMDPSLGIKDIFLSTLARLMDRLEEEIPFTEGHSKRVSDCSTALARAMALDESEVSRVELAALLHDIGRPGADDDVHRVGGSLTDRERALFRRHPVLGSDVLAPLDGLAEVRAAIRHHHERWDGRGYPDGLAAEAIPMWARIIAVAEALDALTTDRSYRPGLTLAEAFGEIQRCAGTQFDPQVVEALEIALDYGDIMAPPRLPLENVG